MQVLSGKVSGNRGAASHSLAPDLARINTVIAEQLGIGHPLVTGTFNVRLGDKKPHLTEECKFERPGEVLSFHRCRIKKSVDSTGVQGVVLETSVHKHSADFQDTFEIMAPYHMCTVFGVTAGDPVVVEIDGDEEWWNRPDELT